MTDRSNIQKSDNLIKNIQNQIDQIESEIASKKAQYEKILKEANESKAKT